MSAALLLPDASVVFDEVFHVGSLDPNQRQAGSQEGDGLSVSVDPDDWARIARLGATTWMLTKPGRARFRFVSYHALTKPERDGLRAWAAANKWMEQRAVYRVSWFDDEAGQQVWSDFDARFEAELEAESIEDAAVTPELAWRPTARFPQRRVATDCDPTDLLLAVYVERMLPEVDGVWWDDEYDPARLSCPRGVLVRDVSGYQARKLHG